MAHGKNTPFRRVFLRFYKTLRQSGVFRLIIGMRRSQVFLRLAPFRRNSYDFTKKLRQQLMGLENKFTADFPYNRS
jgi:hypothetical protein